MFFCQLPEPPRYKDWSKSQVMSDAVKGKREFTPKNAQAVSEKNIHTAATNPKGLFLMFFELTTLLNQ